MRILNRLKTVIKNLSEQVLITQSCLTLCNPVDCNPQGLSVHGILQARTGVDCHSLLQGNLLNPGIEPRSPALRVDSLL